MVYVPFCFQGSHSQASRTATPTPYEIQPIYEAESPDELALVDAACAYNCRLLKRSPTSTIVMLPGKALRLRASMHCAGIELYNQTSQHRKIVLEFEFFRMFSYFALLILDLTPFVKWFLVPLYTIRGMYSQCRPQHCADFELYNLLHTIERLFQNQIALECFPARFYCKLKSKTVCYYKPLATIRGMYSQCSPQHCLLQRTKLIILQLSVNWNHIVHAFLQHSSIPPRFQ